MPIQFNIPSAKNRTNLQLSQYLDTLNLPTHSFGMLEGVLEKLNHATAGESPKLQHLVFCADHGIYERTHQTRQGQLSTAEHVDRMLNGYSPAAKACNIQNIPLTAIDCGLNSPELPEHGSLIQRKIRTGTRDFSSVAAMSQDELEKAVQIGVDTASLAMAEGANVISFGALGYGNTTSAAAMTSSLLKIQPDITVTNQNHKDPSLSHAKKDVVTQAIALHKSELNDGWSTVKHLGGYEIAALMGAIATTAELGGLSLIDGYAGSAAVLALHNHYPQVLDYIQFTNQSAHIAQQRIMATLNQTALLNLNLGLGEGAASIMAWPLITTSAICLEAFNSPQS